MHIVRPSSCRRLVASLLSTLALGAVLTPAAQQDRPVFRSGATSVSVDVIVTGRDGRPVTDLSRADFVIREAGRAQAITAFQHVQVPLGHRTIDLTAPVDPPTDVSDNQRPDSDSRAFAIVIDDGAIAPAAIPHVKQTLAEFLRALAPADRAAIVFIRRSDYGQDFTSDVTRLVGAANRTSAALGWPPDFRATRLVLENAVNTLVAAPQTRKAIIYVSGGHDVVITPPTRDVLGNVRPGLALAKDRSDASDLLMLFDACRQAGVPIYAFDPTSKVGGFMTPEQRRRREARQEFMMGLASATNGLAFTNQSDLAGTARRLIADNGDYYVLGYSPDPFPADGRFHEIQVSVPSRPDVHVRARAGYIAPKPLRGDTTVDEVVRSLGAAQPGGDLKLRAFAAPVAPGTRGTQLAVSLQATYPEATPQMQDDLRVVMIAIDPDGGIKASSDRTLRVAFAGQSFPLALMLDDVIEVPNGKLTLRIAVSSAGLGRAGVVHLPITVRNPSDQNLGVTPLVLALMRPPGPSGAFVAGAERIADLLPFQPTTDRVFHRNDTVQIFSRAFSETRDKLTATVVLRRGARAIQTFTPSRSPFPMDGRALDLRQSIPLHEVAPGGYVIELTVTGPKGKPITTSVPIEVR